MISAFTLLQALGVAVFGALASGLGIVLLWQFFTWWDLRRGGGR